jgi:hypothetical protein
MSAKHTPGPWGVAYLDKNGQAVVKGEHIEIATCWHHCVGAIEKEMHANARLIAAAPELLEALRAFIKAEYLLPNLSGPAAVAVIEARGKAVVAILKATGEGA